MNENHDELGRFSEAAVSATAGADALARSGNKSAMVAIAAHREAAAAHLAAAKSPATDSFKEMHSDIASIHTAHADHIQALHDKVKQAESKVADIAKSQADHAKAFADAKAKLETDHAAKLAKIKTDIDAKLKAKNDARAEKFKAKWGRSPSVAPKIPTLLNQKTGAPKGLGKDEVNRDTTIVNN